MDVGAFRSVTWPNAPRPPGPTVEAFSAGGRGGFTSRRGRLGWDYTRRGPSGGGLEGNDVTGAFLFFSVSVVGWVGPWKICVLV